MAKFQLKVNGKQLSADVDPFNALALGVKDHLHLVGTKYGCGAGACGACTVHLNGNALRSCQLPVSAVGTQAITTIEGIATSETEMHPVQKAWLELDVAQCGYCQTGQMMSAVALLKRNPNPTEAEIEAAMTGNICRCGTYIRIKAAIQQAAKSTTK